MSQFWVAPPDDCCRVRGDCYLGEVCVVSDGLAGGDVLVEGGVGQVGVAGLVVDDVVLVGVTVFPPVAVQSLGVVRVLMHFK